jgi:type III pantothenate kinase
MKLLLDIGNTRIKWGLAESSGLIHSGVLAHDGNPAAALAALQIEMPSQIWVAHVTGPEHETALGGALQQRFGCSPQFARSVPMWRGLRNAYAEPHRLGIDRWLAMIAAWSEAPSAVCVVDAGTALTIDCVDEQGQHLGGVICAGLTTQQRATLGHTRFETRQVSAEYRAGLGRDTEACVREGAMLACLGAIDRGAAVIGARARHLMTGGDARILRPHLQQPWDHRPNLVLEGLLALSVGD